MTHWELARGAVSRGALQKVAELAPFIRLLQRRKTLKSILEIGSCKGGTVWAWMQVAAPDALIVSVDLPGGDFGGGYNEREAERIAGYRQAEQRLELVSGDSHDPSVFLSVVRLLNEQPVDLVFIDGDHSYEGAKKDWHDYGQFGSLVAFHDIVFHPMHPTCQVDRLWGELREQQPVIEFVDRKEAWGGIGVIERG